jgi:[acyl-carrier-protein] S-malonyltransferase
MANVAVSNAAMPLIANGDGEPTTSGRDIVRRLIAQVDRPVRWDLVQQTIARLNPAGLVELAPAGVLAGLAKRGLKGIPVDQVTAPLGAGA